MFLSMLTIFMIVVCSGLFSYLIWLGVWFFYTQSYYETPWLAWKTLSRSGWPGAQRNSPVCAPEVLELNLCPAS